MSSKLIFLCFVSLTLCSGTPALGAKRSSFPRVDWGLRFSAAAIYNDNLLRFSETDINRFHDYDPLFATPVQTLDDFESEYSIRPSIRWRAPMNFMVDAYYNLKAVFRSRNPLTDYQTHTLSASLRPRVRGYRWNLQYKVFRIPSYYLRVYRDRDYNERHAARFSNWDHSLKLSYRVNGKWWFDLNGATGTYYYNRKFTEYDSEYLEGGIGSRFYLPGAVSLSGTYIRRLSDNVGKEQSFIPIRGNSGVPAGEEDSEYGDSDFSEDEFKIRIRRPLGFIKFAPVDVSISYRHRRRVYTTDRSLLDDPFHRGRLDNRFELSPEISIGLSRILNLKFYFTHEERVTESDTESVIRAKEFVRREAGLVIAYKFR